ncbi:MAG: hypothetical protein V4484_08680 [Pseudomonadota bacterium]
MTQQDKPRPRGALQFVAPLLLLIYLVCAWRNAASLWALLNIGVIAPATVLLMAAGTALLVLGVARATYRAWLGKYVLLLAALQLAFGAAQIGNWDYKVSQGVLATLMLGVVIAVFGAWRAHRAGAAPQEV